MPAELTNAATKIQASFRGHLTRKNQKINTEQEALTKELKRLDTKVRYRQSLFISRYGVVN